MEVRCGRCHGTYATKRDATKRGCQVDILLSCQVALFVYKGLYRHRMMSLNARCNHFCQVAVPNRTAKLPAKPTACACQVGSTKCYVLLPSWGCQVLSTPAKLEVPSAFHSCQVGSAECYDIMLPSWKCQVLCSPVLPSGTCQVVLPSRSCQANPAKWNLPSSAAKLVLPSINSAAKWNLSSSAAKWNIRNWIN